MQTSYSNLSGTSFAGMLADSADNNIESGIASAAMNHGCGVAASANDTLNVHMPTLNKCILTLDADFSADNVITVTVNGVACSAVTFASSQAVTSAAVLAAIQANAGVLSASVSANGRVYTIKTTGAVAAVSIAITGGTYAGTYPVVAIAYSCDDVFRGVVVYRAREMTGLGVAQGYAAKDVVDILRKGKIWVAVSEAVTADAAAYVQLAAGAGKFGVSNSSDLATGGVFRSATTGAGVAVLEINLP
jgi:hypothetical protein